MTTMSKRTELARDLSVLAEDIAAKLEVSSDADLRASAARTLRMLGTNIVRLSESTDTLEENYNQAMKLADDAAKIANQSLKSAETLADAIRGPGTGNVKN